MVVDFVTLQSDSLAPRGMLVILLALRLAGVGWVGWVNLEREGVGEEKGGIHAHSYVQKKLKKITKNPKPQIVALHHLSC